MSMTRPKQGLAEGGGNSSNGSKTTEKKVIEGGIVNCANVPKNIGKTGF